MKKNVWLLLVLVAALFAAGCFDYSEQMVLNADGSGTLRQHMVMYKDGFDALEQMMDSFAPDSAQDTSMFSFVKRVDVEKKLAKVKGVKLIDFQESQTDSTATYDIKYSFTDLSAMMTITSDWGESDMVESMAPEKVVSFTKESSGGWKYTREFGDSSMNNFMNPGFDAAADEESEDEADSAEAADPFGEMGKMMEKMMMQAFANRKVKVTVKFPGQVVKSNATKVDGAEATWEYKLVDMAKAPRNLEATIK